MKVTINVECTPEEARRYMGLPDVTELNTHIMENMAEQMGAMGPDKFMNAWGPFFDQMTEFWSGQALPKKK